MQLKQACDEFLKGYFSTNERRKKTEIAYSSDLGQFQAFAGEQSGLQSLDGEVIERWATHLRQEGYAPASMRRKMVALKVFCSYWVRKKGLPESPFWRVKLSFGRIEQLPRTLTDTEVRALLAQAQRNYAAVKTVSFAEATTHCEREQAFSQQYRALRNLALLDLLFATGLRVGEVSTLDIKDFLFEDASFRVRGKGGRDRLAFAVDAETVQIQQLHLKARMRIESEEPALFLNAQGDRLSTQGIANILSQLRREAGIERHVTPHMLRHTVATQLLRNGVDIRVVQEFLGHTSIATTQRYTHISKEHLVGLLQKHHPSLTLRAQMGKA